MVSETPAQPQGVEGKAPKEKPLKTWEEWRGYVKYSITFEDRSTLVLEKFMLWDSEKDQWSKDVWVIDKFAGDITITMKEAKNNLDDEDEDYQGYREEEIVRITYTSIIDPIYFWLDEEKIETTVKKHGVRTTMRKILEYYLNRMRSDLEIDTYLSDDC